jgi:hypothetical protein
MSPTSLPTRPPQAAEQSQMTTYYLDNSSLYASNSNAGTSPDAPWKTLAALSRAFQTGDVVCIKAGTTYSGTLTITADGTADAPVTFTRYGTGADPLITTGREFGIDMEGATHVVIDHIAVQGATVAGVYMDATSGFNTLRNMNVSRCGFGYEIDGAHDNLFTANYVHDLKMVNNTYNGGTDDYGAVAFSLEGGNNNEFSYNNIINARAPSYDFGYDGGAFEFWNGSNNTSIHDNWVQNSDGFVEVGGDTAGASVSNVQIYNNVYYNSVSKNEGFAWLHNDTSGDFGIGISNFNVYNNTIVAPIATAEIVGFDTAVAPGSFSFTDNIVYAPKDTYVYDQAGTWHTGNFYQVAAYSTPSGVGETSGIVNFVNASGDFALKDGSNAAGDGAYVNGHPGLPVAVAKGSTVTVASGTSFVNITGSATVTVPYSTTVNCGNGTDTITVTAGNVTVNGSSSGALNFIESGTGLTTLNLTGGSTTATFGSGAATVSIAGALTATDGSGVDLFNLINDTSIDTVVINGFKLGTDHLHLVGYAGGTADVASLEDLARGTGIALTDGTQVTLNGVHGAILAQLFS